MKKKLHEFHLLLKVERETYQNFHSRLLEFESARTQNYRNFSKLNTQINCKDAKIEL